ncbi:MAG TPA: NADH-quinone oxidoreductase subunit NuoN [Gammaproteobacteria bacterium]|nr:NADH-quinone oxidoreductase subunit NuoN [Gammaproteobacteria bacterium]
MNFTMPLFSLAAPEIAILCLLSITLLVDVFLPQRLKVLTYFLTQVTLITAFIITVSQYHHTAGMAVTFNDHYIVDKLAILSKLVIYVLSFVSFAYARPYIAERDIPRSEYYILGLFCVLGMSVMASAFSFLTIYLGLELLSLPLYAMVASYKNSQQATEAGMKYFVMGALASAMFLYGVSLIYGLTGSVELPVVALSIQSAPSATALLALVFIIAALLFKFGAVPFHMWVPDVYQGAPTSVTLFIASAPKVAAFAITLRILAHAVPEMHVAWQQILVVISVLSMFFGNVLAIAQTNIKRMLAYSSIAHIGYTLLGIIAGPASNNGYSAAMFYVSTYVLVAAGAFAVVAILSRAGVELDRLEDYRGLNARSPWLAFMMLLLMFSMAGVPPTVGFFAKFGLLVSLVEAHYVWLAVAALIFALIGAYYYLRVVMLMYFEEPLETYADKPVKLSKEMMVVISINGIAALILGVLPSALIDLCRISAT